MSDFCISLEPVAAQKSYLSGVADALNQCKSIVNNAGQGLFPIGLLEVHPAIEAIELRLTKHQKNCKSMEEALNRIVHRFHTAESNILGQKSLFEMIREMKGSVVEKIHDLERLAAEAFNQFTRTNPTTIDEPREDDYVGVIYLINDEGAKKQGHAAIILVKANGEYEYYSFRGQDGLFCDAEMDVDLDGVNDRYSNYVYIPIDNDSGIKMHDYAQEIVDDPGKYSVLDRNCNIIAQEILHQGKVDFADMDFAWVNTRPNTVYQNFMDTVSANSDDYPGYHFGNIDDNDPAVWIENGGLDHLIDGCDCDTANIDNVTFEDPMGWVNIFAKNSSSGVSMIQAGQLIQNGYISNSYANTLYGGTQAILDLGWDASQSVSEAIASIGNIDWRVITV